jgi:hypothetical protein
MELKKKFLQMILGKLKIVKKLGVVFMMEKK